MLNPNESPLIQKSLGGLFIFGRPPLVFAALIYACLVMFEKQPVFYLTGLLFLILATLFDVADGWLAARYQPDFKLAHLTDRIMDKIVHSILFPLVTMGMLWRYYEFGPQGRLHFWHAVFVLLICIVVLVRDSFNTFLRNMALKSPRYEEHFKIARLRTTFSAPLMILLYAYAFYVPGPDTYQYWTIVRWLGNIPLQFLTFFEILFLVLTLGTLARYARKYGQYTLDEFCGNDEDLRRRLLSMFPNALTLMNALMGVAAVVFADLGRMKEAYLMLIAAGMFDRLDGAMARRLGLTAPQRKTDKGPNITFGGILDDLSDAISFCLAPALMFYFVMNDVDPNIKSQFPTAAIALFYAFCGIGRLLFFTFDRTPVPGFFKGMPTPAGAFMVCSPLIMLSQSSQAASGSAEFWAWTACILMVVASLLMVAIPIRYIHFGRFLGRNPWVMRGTALLLLIFVFTPYFGHATLVYLLGYVFSPLFTGHIDPKIAAKETK